MTVPMNDQRKAARVDLQAHVEIDVPSPTTAASPTSPATSTRLEADSLNFSEGGICVRLQEALEIRSRIRLRLFAEPTKRPLECAGQVAWIVQRLDLRDTPPFVYDIGVQFIDPPSSLRQFASRAGVALKPIKNNSPRVTHASLQPATLNERYYVPRVDLEAASGLWHLIVWVDGVPCFSHRYPSQREAIEAWGQFQRATQAARRPTRRLPAKRSARRTGKPASRAARKTRAARPARRVRSRTKPSRRAIPRKHRKSATQ